MSFIDVFIKYACVKSSNDKKSKSGHNGFRGRFIAIVNESHCKPDKLCIDQGREFYNKLMKKLLDGNDILDDIYSVYNESK